MTDKSSSAKFHICILSRRHYSSSKGRLGIFQRANERYEKFLEHRFPRLYILYTTFVKGFWLMVHDVRETRKIRMKMLTQDVSLKDLPYREMETIILFHKDLIKAIPLVIISIPPFAIILVFTLMCLFPRQLLIHHLWTPQQQQDFQRLYHEQRCRHRENILKGVAWSIAHIKEWTLRSHLLTLISKRGAHPSVKDINAVRCMFSGQPLGISGMASGHMAAVLPPLAEPLVHGVRALAPTEGQSPGPVLLGSGSGHTRTGPAH
ncbi:hypothetical protein J4Q44_G00105910 [Coregonus suidteri]|uniref:Letm1 RBD domain-containing protein n=1 Tax=Coregonus suidteri TaxID=861788 RepID=A0AAN8LVM0_9TELE